MSLRQNALLLAVLTALLAIVGTWSNDRVLASVWLLPLGLLLLGLAYEGWTMTRAQLQIAMMAPGPCVLGRAVPLQMELRHRLSRDANVELAPDAPPAIEVDRRIRSLTLVADRPNGLRLCVTPRRLGRHPWPHMRARVGGVLGLAWWTQPLAPQFVMHVVPELLHTSAQRASSAGTGARAKLMPGAGTQVLQLRDYRAGDPLHVIDWKATARTGRLVSRDFSEDQHLEIIVAIDAGRAGGLRAGQLDRFGHYANLAARFAEHAVAQDDRVGLVIYADRPLAAIAPMRGTAAVLRVRATLAAATQVQAESNPLNAALRIRTLARHRSLIVMLADLDDSAVAGQLAAAARLLLPKHLPLIAGLSSPEAQTLAHAESRAWLDPYEALAAQEYCADLERNVHALRALGAPALIARPLQLERAVFEAYAEFRRKRRV